MELIKSCGFVAYTAIDSEIKYLLIKTLNGDVGFPKGHMEMGESEIETAMRELYEETGAEIEHITDMRRQIEYEMPAKNAIKQAVYFLGSIKEPVVLTPQASEVADVRLLAYDEALEWLTFAETKRILTEANRYIRGRGK